MGIQRTHSRLKPPGPHGGIHLRIAKEKQIFPWNVQTANVVLKQSQSEQNEHVLLRMLQTFRIQRKVNDLLKYNLIGSFFYSILCLMQYDRDKKISFAKTIHMVNPTNS